MATQDDTDADPIEVSDEDEGEDKGASDGKAKEKEEKMDTAKWRKFHQILEDLWLLVMMHVAIVCNKLVRVI